MNTFVKIMAFVTLVMFLGLVIFFILAMRGGHGEPAGSITGPKPGSTLVSTKDNGDNTVTMTYSDGSIIIAIKPNK